MARVKTTFQRVYALQHQHICPLYLLDEDPRFGWYLVMKFIDGQTLSSYRATYAARHGSFPVEQAVKVLRPVAEALDYAHRNKVIHRDIKPQNILVVGDSDDVQIVDFGLAAEIRTRVSRYSREQMDTSGTRPYMAPEQWKGQFQDARTDQYAFAVVAYELLAGHLPFEVDDTEVLRLCVLNEPPEGIEGQAEPVNRALLLGLAKLRQERFGNCVEFVQAMAIGASSERPKPLSVVSNSIGMNLVLIPAGEFLMGSEKSLEELLRCFPACEVEEYADKHPENRVRITQPCEIGQYPVPAPTTGSSTMVSVFAGL
jgi:serine/threonine-protein kinase